MTRQHAWCYLVPILLIIAMASPVRSEISARQVNESIDRGVQYLKSKQNRKGDWTDLPGYSESGGVTALCTLALLEWSCTRS